MKTMVGYCFTNELCILIHAQYTMYKVPIANDVPRETHVDNGKSTNLTLYKNSQQTMFPTHQTWLWSQALAFRAKPDSWKSSID